MGDGSVSESSRENVIERLIDVQYRSIPFLIGELTKYHAGVNKDSYFCRLPEDQKIAWLRYGFEHIANLYRIGRRHENTTWEKNLAFSSMGGGFRGVSESMCGMMVVSHLLVPIVREEFAGNPVEQSMALEMLSEAYENLTKKSLAVYNDFVRAAFNDMLGSYARSLEEIRIEGLLVNSENTKSIDEYRLTKREIEVLQLVGLGYENGEICGMLHTKLDTVKGHVRNLMAKTHLHNRTQLALLAVSAGICKKADVEAALERARW